MAQASRFTPSSILLLAGIIGVAGGIGSVAATPEGRKIVSQKASGLAIATGLKRAREPQPGDYWRGCNEARAAGSAPIYRGEPGYRPEMDGDNDGIACEPYH